MTMNRIELSWRDVEKQVQEILRQMHQDQWRPDYVVGITRGGLVPANMISQYLGCRMETLKVKLRDCEANEQCESNLWMAEDAIGVVPPDEKHLWGHHKHLECLKKKILIVDDINDSGATLDWIKQDWPSGCFPDSGEWETIWGNNVRVAVLYDNEASKTTMPITYSAIDINKAENDCWIVFPWEAWWK